MTILARTAPVVLLALPVLLAPDALAQRGTGNRGGGHMGGGRAGGGGGARIGPPARPGGGFGAVNPGYPRPAGLGPIGQGFGNVVFPATGIPPVTGHIPGLSSTIRGVPYSNAPRGGYGRSGGIYPVAVPVAVPAYGVGYGGYYGAGGYDYQYSAPAPVVINTAPPSPAVVINQNYQPDRVRPVMREYGAPSPGSDEPTVSSYQAPIPSNPDPPRSIEDDKPTVYLIAMADGTVYSAYAYWVEGDTLHYITTRHSHNQASLSLVDAPLSTQLNRERDVEFRLRK
ncbi:MAG: hypothetical protein R2762_03410 [Bryobacteraceae bacterium]